MGRSRRAMSERAVVMRLRCVLRWVVAGEVESPLRGGRQGLGLGTSRVIGCRRVSSAWFPRESRLGAGAGWVQGGGEAIVGAGDRWMPERGCWGAGRAMPSKAFLPAKAASDSWRNKEGDTGPFWLRSMLWTGSLSIRGEVPPSSSTSERPATSRHGTGSRLWWPPRHSPHLWGLGVVLKGGMLRNPSLHFPTQGPRSRLIGDGNHQGDHPDPNLDRKTSSWHPLWWPAPGLLARFGLFGPF